MATRIWLGAIIVATYIPLCTPRVQVTPAPPPQLAPAVTEASLWQRPDDLERRDLYYGPWGPERAPDPATTYTFLRPKESGSNPGMVVTDPAGREWHIKQAPRNERDPEGPVEVVLSRVLSAVGYHQPPVYFLPAFTLSDGEDTHSEPGGRFRLDEKGLKNRGEWSWQQNPFVGTKPYQGLLVILVMFNSSDLKNSNNILYEVKKPKGGPSVWYVVRDLGTALGDTDRFAPRRGDPQSFERHGFIEGVRNGFIEFEYHGFHQELLKQRITPADVGWACDLLARLTPVQWRDAFRAGGYSPEIAARFIARLHQKIADGRRWAKGAQIQ